MSRHGAGLCGLRWGVLPAVHVARGRAELVRNLPLMMELVHTGWRPAACVQTDPRLWVARYGQGTNTAMTVSNPTRETILADLLISVPITPRPVGLIFAYHEKTTQSGVPLVNRLNGRATRLTFPLAPKEFRVLRAIATIEGASASWAVEAKEHRDPQNCLVYEVIAKEGYRKECNTSSASPRRIPTDTD